MATRADELPTRPPLTLVQKLAIFALILGGLAVAYNMIKPMVLGDEPPIRVRNGSMDIELDKGKWVGNVSGWSPSEGKPSGTHAVEVKTAGAHTCPALEPGATWQVVTIAYTDGAKILLTPSGSSRTVVTPKSDLVNPSAEPRLLRHGSKGEGYISEIDLRGGGRPWACTFTAANQLAVINVCPASKPGC
jgi:hypothetical protein